MATIPIFLTQSVVRHPAVGTQAITVVGRMSHSLKIIKGQLAIVSHN